ncbi:MoxR family ATPase [Myxococcota bacterium]|nr:MoxR family ATPase [Myxococcota bacterium]
MTESRTTRDIQEQIREKSEFVQRLRQAIGEVIVGQQDLVERLLVGLLANGHVLVEGVPGLAKTTVVKALADALDASFQRLQFTPDMLPSDILGTEIYEQQKGTFSVKKGPIFANIILADEINRAPSKVQSALLEAMQERQVTIGHETFALPAPFLVMATQNPIEQEGTYPLPEAQVDRFMLKLNVTYPSKEDEKAIMRRIARTTPKATGSVVRPEEILAARELLKEIRLEDRLEDYIVDLIVATRSPQEYGLNLGRYIQYGASPRGTIFLHQAARAMAFLRGRDYVIPQDVKSIAPDILRHRLLLSYEAEAEDIKADDIIRELLEQIEVP